MFTDLTDWGPRLEALAQFEAPPDGWRAVLAARESREARLDRRWPMAFAAVVLAATVGLAVWLQSAQRVRVAGSASLPATPAMVAGARAENDRLERLLARLPERRAMRGRTAFTVAELEDRIVLIDDRLSRVSLEPHAPERAERLWQERAEVLHSLVQVRYADAVGTY